MIEVDKKLIGCSEQIVVGRSIVGRVGDTTREFSDELGPLLLGQRLELLKKPLRRLRHEISLARCAVGVKLFGIPEASRRANERGGPLSHAQTHAPSTV